MLRTNQRDAIDSIAFVHLSDLHIGTSLMPAPEEFAGGVYSGYNPHDYRLLRPLELALGDARRRVACGPSEPLYLVISGDLTQSGLDNDFATARALVHERWEWRSGPRARTIGLGWPRALTFTVPGNHDHWRHRTRQVAHNRGLAPDFFDATPWMRPIESREGSLRLELYGVDSNSGLEDPENPVRRNLFARGELSEKDELPELSALLIDAQTMRSPERSVVRALVCHHAFSGGGMFGARPLEEQSRNALLTMAGKHDIAAVLTGHTHEFAVHEWLIPSGSGNKRVLKELRCGTTLQGTTARPSFHGFWLHQITTLVGSHTAQWTAWKYQVGAGDFDVDTVTPIIFDVPQARTQPSL